MKKKNKNREGKKENIKEKRILQEEERKEGEKEREVGGEIKKQVVKVR